MFLNGLEDFLVLSAIVAVLIWDDIRRERKARKSKGIE